MSWLVAEQGTVWLDESGEFVEFEPNPDRAAEPELL